MLAEHCYSCHGEKKQSGGLRLDTAAGLAAGADNGPVVVAGDPAKSRLIECGRSHRRLPDAAEEGPSGRSGRVADRVGEGRGRIPASATGRDRQAGPGQALGVSAGPAGGRTESTRYTSTQYGMRSISSSR